MSDHLKNLSQVYLEQIAESAVPGKPAEKLKTDRAGYSIPKADQMSAAERIKKKTAAKKTNVKYDPHMKVMAPQKEEVEQVDEADSLAAMQARREKRLAAQRKREGTTSTGRDFGRDDSLFADQQKKRRDAEFKAGIGTKKEEVEVDEAMSSYDRNRKRAAQRAADRNAARAAGKTGVVPGVGYVTPNKERETYTDEKGTVRHKSGAKNEELEHLDEVSDRKVRAVRDAREKQWNKQFGKNRVQDPTDDMVDKVDKLIGQRNKRTGSKVKKTTMGQLRDKLRREQVSVYDIVLSHLLDEGYADTVESAEGIMINMSEEWRDSIVEGQQLGEAMSSYDRNRKRAAQRAAERNAARAAGKTGVVPGVGYVSPRKERETYTDEKGTNRHKSGAKMP